MLVIEFLVGAGLGIILLLFYFLKNSFFKVEEGHLAVITKFGKAEMIEATENNDKKQRILKTYGPGAHWIHPWKKVLITSMMERNLDLSGENGGITAMAEDGTIFRLDSKLRYAPLKEELYTYLFIMKNPTAHIKGLFTCLLRNEIANFGAQSNESPETYSGSYALIRRERRLLNQHISDFCQNKISGRYGGVKFCAVDLTDILPPDELAEALNAVFNAQTEAETLFAHTEAECQQRVLASEQGVSIAKAHAEASEIEIRTLAGFLSTLQENGTLSLYVDRRRAEVLAESRAVYRRNFQ